MTLNNIWYALLILVGMPLNIVLSVCGIPLAKRDPSDPNGKRNAAFRHSMWCGVITLAVIALAVTYAVFR